MSGDLGVTGLLALFGVVAFGAVIPVVPTGAAVSAAAVLARAEHPWEVVLVLLVGGAGAYAGDVVTYAALRTAGAPLAHRVGWLRADDPDGTLQHLRARLEADEVRSLLLSRLVPGGRIPVLLAAALGGYPLVRFASANVAAALLWSCLYGGIGLVGDTLIPDPVVAVVVVVLAALAVGLVLPRLRRSRRDDAAQGGADVRPAGPA
ncbi:DedA family protein [Nocardioides dongxiaopingii]|uniref:DedA family protein n=1 Tax=Nocardioides dongxiaopingii TaxID=2576036 RepID=UPI0010C76345|nr:VTT domain-containing protein [Nocardioides dongxiaopingii]